MPRHARRLLVVLNPQAAAGRSMDDRVRLQALAARGGGTLCVSESTDALPQLVAHAGLGADDALAIVGGDGSVGAIVSAFAADGRELPHLALLRGGTMNTIANGLGIPRRSPETLLRRLLAELGAPELPCLLRSTLRVEGREGFLFGAGVIASFLEAYNALPRAGIVDAGRLLLRASLGAVAGRGQAEPIIRPLSAQLTLDGAACRACSYPMIAASTVPELGLGFAAMHRASECLERLHVLAFEGPMRQLALRLPAFHRGRPLPARLGVDALATTLEIRADAGAFQYALDGDLHTAHGPLQIRASPPRRLWRPRA